jgi:hypothetical protein
LSLLQLAKKKQNELNLGGILYLSDKLDKKLMLIYNGKKIHFGLKGSNTYLEGADESKRKAYRARHKKIQVLNGDLAYKVKYSPSYLSWHLLW